MRLFTGLELPAHVEAKVDRILRPWREAAPDLKWSPLANLHITTKFIGEWPESRLAELKDALAQVPKPGPLTIPVRGVGWFPNPQSPHSLFAVIDPIPPGLRDLAANTQNALAQLDIAKAQRDRLCDPRNVQDHSTPVPFCAKSSDEDRAYQPHITLARLNRPPAAQTEALRQTIASHPQLLDFGVIEARSFFLYLSQPESRGSIYKRLAEFSFQ